jgi:flagellar protein FlaJ
MYMTLSLFPLLLIIILVAMSLLGDSQMTLMYGVVYGLLPLIGVAFLVLVSTVKSDEIGEGTLTLNGEVPTERTTNPLVDEGLVDQYDNETNVFDRIRTGEDTYNTTTILQKPHIFFRDNPLYILALTAPMSLVVLAMAIVSPSVPTTFDGIRQAPVWPTFVYLYLPLYINFVPLAIFREWNHRYRYGILTDFSETLRKLSSANDTGETLFDSLETVADSSRGRLAKEFRIMYEKVQYGTNINRALLEFNNKFRIPRLARSIKLISKAQEASNQITEVLTTAAQASENQDDIDRERKSQARMQVVIIMMTFCTLLFVMAILKVEFLETMADLVDASSGDGSSGSSAGGGAGAGGAVGGSGQSFGASIDVPLLSMLFFHAVTLQAVLSGIISGYMRDASILSGVKYSVVLMSLALAVWVAIG